MEYLHVLHRLFHEDMEWLTSQYLPTTNHKRFFKETYPELYTHYSFVIDSEKKEPSILKYSETPFYRYQIDTPKEGYRDVNLKEDLGQRYSYLTHAAGFDTKNIERIYYKEHKNKLHVDIFLRASFENLSDMQLCYYYYHEQITTIRDNIKQHLHMLFFDESKKEKQRKKIIRKYQVKLNSYIAFLERKFKALDHTDPDIRKVNLQRTIVDIYKCVCLGLEETLMYIEEFCGQYINKDLPISYLKRRNFLEHYFDTSRQLIQLFRKQQLPKSIQEEVCKPLYTILNDHLHSMTYIRRAYYRKYIDLFTRLLTKTESPNHDTVYRLLIALDYNTHNVYKAMEAELLVRLDQEDTPTAKQSLLFRQLHNIQSIAVTSPYKYNPEFPGLQEYLIDFIRKQIDLHQKQIALERHTLKKVVEAPAPTTGLIDTSSAKRKVNLTVSEIALISRLFVETGVINLQGNKQHYFRFLSTIYASKDMDHISEKSVKNSFYTISSDTFETVERLLIRILSKLQMLRDTKA